MGCDIHATIEQRLGEKSNYWFNAARNIEIDRCYELFGYLAGVRDETVQPIIQVRGLPDDISHEAKAEYEEMSVDAHTMSWILFSEIKKLPDKFKEEPFYVTMEAFAKNYGENNVRMVFFFDN